MAKPCEITYKGKKYSYAEYIDLMVQGEFDSLVNDGIVSIGKQPKAVSEAPPTPPRTPITDVSEAEPEGDNKFRSVALRAAQEMEDGIEFLAQKTSQYKVDDWESAKPKAQETVDAIFDAATKPDGSIDEQKAIAGLNKVIDALFAQFTKPELLSMPLGGTILSFVLLEAQDRFNELEMLEAQKVTLSRLAQLATFTGQMNSALAQRAHQKGLLALQVQKTIDENNKLQEEEMVDAVTSLKEAMADLQEQLKNKDEEIAELLASKAVEKAKAKAVAKKVTVFGRATNPNKEKVKAIKEKINAIKAKYQTVGFAATPKGGIIDLLKDIKDYLLLNIELGAIQIVDKQSVIEALEELKIDAAKYGYDNDRVWNEVYTPEFQALEGKAKSEYIADKLATHIKNTLDGKPSTTPQGKVLDSIVAALITATTTNRNKSTTTFDNAITMLKNKELSVAAARDALARVIDVVNSQSITQDQKDALIRQAEDIVSAMTKKGLPMAVIRAEIRQGLKDMGETIDSVAKQHYSERNRLSEQLYNNLTDKLVALGIDRADAEVYAKALEQEFANKLGKKRAAIIDKVLNPSPKQTRESLAKRLTDLLMVDSEGKAANAYLEKRNLPALTPDELDAIKALGKDKQGVQSLVETYVNSRKVDNAINKMDGMSKDRVKAFNEKVDKKVAAVMARLKDISGINAVNSVLAVMKLEPLTYEQYVETQKSGGTSLEQMVRNRVKNAALFTEMGRNSQGNKRTARKRRGLVERLTNLVRQGALEEDMTTDILSDVFGFPNLNQEDRTKIEALVTIMNTFHGEIAKRAEKEMLDYIESRRLGSGGNAVQAGYALLRLMKSANVTLLLGNFKTLFVSIPIGSLLAYATQGIPLALTARANNNAAYNLAKQLKAQYQNPKLGLNDAINTMRTGVSSLMSDFEGKYTDKQQAQGSLLDYYLNQRLPNLKPTLLNAPELIAGYFYKTVFTAVRFAQAFDLLLVTPTGELLNVYSQILAEAKRQGIDVGDVMQGPIARKEFIAEIEKRMGYAQKDAITQKVDEDIALLKLNNPKYVTAGLRERMIQSYMIAERDSEIMEKSYNVAKALGFMNTPTKGSVTAKVLQGINKFGVSEEFITKQVESSKMAYALFVPAFMAEFVKMIAVPMARIGLVIGGTAVKQSPIIGTSILAVQLAMAKKAKDELEVVRKTSELATNVALGMGLVALIMSMLDKDDDEKDEVSVNVPLFGDVKFKSNPPIKLYGKRPTSFYKGQQLLISVEDGEGKTKSIPMPEYALQLGNGEPILLRFAPQTIGLSSIVGSILSQIKYEEITYDEKTRKHVLQPKSVNVGDLLYAFYSGLSANTFAIGATNMEKLATGANAYLVGDADGEKVDDLARQKEDFLKVVTSPLKNLTSPALYSDIWKGAKSLNYLTGGDINEEYSQNPMGKFVADHIFLEAIPTVWNGITSDKNKKEIMKQTAYDIYGMPYPPDVTFDDIANSYMSIFGQLPSNFEKPLDRRDKMPLNKIFIDKGVTPPTKGVWAVDVTPQLIGKAEGEKVTAQEVAMVDQYVKLKEATVLAQNYPTLVNLQGQALFDRVKDIRNAQRRIVLKSLMASPKKEEQIRKEIDILIEQMDKWNAAQMKKP